MRGDPNQVDDPHDDAPMADRLPETPKDLQVWLDQQERAILVRALAEAGFNRTAAAASLGLNLRQIRYRMSRLAITAPANVADRRDDVG